MKDAPPSSVPPACSWIDPVSFGAAAAEAEPSQANPRARKIPLLAPRTVPERYRMPRWRLMDDLK